MEAKKKAASQKKTHPAGAPIVAPLETEDALYNLGLILVLLQLTIPCIIPVLDMVLAFSNDRRFFPYSLVHIIGNTMIGFLGLAANIRRQTTLLAVHFTSAISLGCMLGLLAILVSHLANLQCNLKPETFSGCDTSKCGCLLTDSCDSDDFANVLGCADCQAIPNDICSYFNFSRVIKGFNFETYKGVVTVSMAILSASNSLILLVRKEHSQSVANSRKEWIEKQIRAQQAKMRSGEVPDMENFQLKRLVRMCEDVNPDMANRAKKIINSWEKGELPGSASKKRRKETPKRKKNAVESIG